LVEIAGASTKLGLDDVRAALAFNQPKLHAIRNGSGFVVTGDFLVHERPDAISPAGPIAEFGIEITVSERYPSAEPKVFEVKGRIPRVAERHINPDGDCCVTVWEHWLVAANDRLFAAFLGGPLREYFLGQFWFEKTGKWPFGERPHGRRGLEEAYADALGIANKKADILYYLRLLAKDWPKGHWCCPCGSGKLLRHCHRAKLMSLHHAIPPTIARRMLQRLREYEK
jgi:hypothetical protein